MKKIIAIIITILIIFSIGGFRYKYITNKHKDINYSVERYMTTGLFNKYKLYKLDNIEVSFSDNNIAIMSVEGMLDKAPHKNVKYKVFLEKNKNGVWKVKKVYEN